MQTFSLGTESSVPCVDETVPLALESDMPSNEYEVSFMLSGFVQVRSNHGFMQGTCFSKSTRDANFVPHTGQLEAAFGAGPGECGPLWPS